MSGERDAAAKIHAALEAFLARDREYREGDGHWSIRLKAEKALDDAINAVSAPGAGRCVEGDKCVCGGDVPAVRASCGNWRAAAPATADLVDCGECLNGCPVGKCRRAAPVAQPEAPAVPADADMASPEYIQGWNDGVGLITRGYMRAALAAAHTAPAPAAPTDLAALVDHLSQPHMYPQLAPLRELLKPKAVPRLTEDQILACLVEAGCLGTVKLSFECGPYQIDRPSLNAEKFARAVEAAVRAACGVKS